MDKKVIIIVVIVICVLLICSSISSGVGGYLYSDSASKTPEETTTNPKETNPKETKPKTDNKKSKETPVPVITTVPGPILQAGTLQWQYNCPPKGDCIGLTWTSSSKKFWNKYYKFSCVNQEGRESEHTKVFGPVNNKLFSNPTLRLAANGVNACGSNKVRIYRSDDNDNFEVIPDDQLKNANQTDLYNGTDAIFTDTWSGPVSSY